MKRRYIFTALAVLMTAFIFWNSSKPAVESANASGGFAELLAQALAFIGVYVDQDTAQKIVRKAAHIAEFALHAMLISESFTGKYHKRVVYILFLGLLTACTDEYIQLFPEGRAGLVSDIFIDFAGTAAGTCISGIFGMKRRK